MQSSDLIPAHLEWCADVGMSDNTIKHRAYVLYALDRELRGDGVPGGIDQASPKEIRKFIGRPDSNRTKLNYRCHLDGFYRWGVDEEILDFNPVTKIRKAKVPPLLPKPVTEELLAEILASAVQPFHLIAVLGAFAGLRACEISTLGPDHITEQRIRIIGKGNKEAIIDTHELVWAEVSHFPGRSPFIVQAGGKPDPKWVSRETGRYFRYRLGVAVTAHMFRHRFGTAYLQQTKNLRATQLAMRHSSITSTAGYTAVTDEERRIGTLALPVPTAAAW